MNWRKECKIWRIIGKDVVIFWTTTMPVAFLVYALVIGPFLILQYL